MSILARYILREFLRTFVYGLAVAITLYTVIELFQRLDTFIENRANIVDVIKYLLYLLPGLVVLLCPVAVLLATFITIGILSRNFEIMALRAGGVSLNRIVVPLLVCTFMISIVSAFGSELVAPYATRKAEQTYQKIKGRDYGKMKISQNQIWYRGKGVIYNVKMFNLVNDILEGVTLYYFDTDFRLTKRIDAQRAQWFNNQWVFVNATIRTFHPDKETETMSAEYQVVPLDETPDTFKQEGREPQEMNFLNLKDYIEKTTQEGYDTAQYLADLYAKTSSPFINFIIALFGVPFAIRIGRHGGFALGVTLSFVVGFSYWVFFNICLALGHGGALPPLVSAWIANVIFAALGAWSLLQIRY